MPDLSEYKDGITICTAEKWEEQMACTVENREKSANRNCCMWFAVNGYDFCGNPDAGKCKDGVQ